MNGVYVDRKPRLRPTGRKALRQVLRPTGRSGAPCLSLGV